MNLVVVRNSMIRGDQIHFYLIPRDVNIKKSILKGNGIFKLMDFLVIMGAQGVLCNPYRVKMEWNMKIWRIELYNGWRRTYYLAKHLTEKPNKTQY